MTVLLVNAGLANLVVFVVLAACGVVAWYFMRRNLRGIDFDEVPSGPALKERGDEEEPGTEGNRSSGKA